MNSRSPHPFSRSSNSNRGEAFIAAANRCVMKMWWSRPGKEGALDSKYRGHSSLRRCSHTGPLFLCLSGPLEFEGSMWAAGEESIHHVTHTATGANPNGAGFLNPYLTPHHKYNYTQFQPLYSKPTLRTSSSPRQQGSEHVHRLLPQGEMKEGWSLKIFCS